MDYPIPESFSNLCHAYAFMTLIKGEMASNSWLLRGILIPDENQESDAIRS